MLSTPCRLALHLLKAISTVQFILATGTNGLASAQSLQVEDTTITTGEELKNDNSTKPSFIPIPEINSFNDVTGPKCAQSCLETFVKDFVKAGECASPEDWDCLCYDHATTMLDHLYAATDEMGPRTLVLRAGYLCAVKYCTKKEEIDWGSAMSQLDKKCQSLYASGNALADAQELASTEDESKKGEKLDYTLDILHPNRTGEVADSANPAPTSTTIVTQTATIEKSNSDSSEEELEAATAKMSIPGLTIISGLLVGMMGYWVL